MGLLVWLGIGAVCGIIYLFYKLHEHIKMKQQLIEWYDKIGKTFKYIVTVKLNQSINEYVYSKELFSKDDVVMYTNGYQKYFAIVEKCEQLKYIDLENNNYKKSVANEYYEIKLIDKFQNIYFNSKTKIGLISQYELKKLKKYKAAGRTQPIYYTDDYVLIDKNENQHIEQLLGNEYIEILSFPICKIVGVRFLESNYGCYYYLTDEKINLESIVVVPTSTGEKEAKVIFYREYNGDEELPYEYEKMKKILSIKELKKMEPKPKEIKKSYVLYDGTEFYDDDIPELYEVPDFDNNDESYDFYDDPADYEDY